MDKQDKQLASFQLSCSIVILYTVTTCRIFLASTSSLSLTAETNTKGKNFQRYTIVLKAPETHQSRK
jgi:hypothetical protein